MHPLSTHPSRGATSTAPAVLAQRGESHNPPLSQSLSGAGGAVVRFGGYGGLAVAAWLLTAVATGSGVAFADDSTSAASTSSSTSSSSPGPRANSASDSDTDSSNETIASSSGASSAANRESSDEQTDSRQSTGSAASTLEDTDEVTDPELDSDSPPVATTPVDDVSETAGDSDDNAPASPAVEDQDSAVPAVTIAAPPTSVSTPSGASERRTEKADQTTSPSVNADDAADIVITTPADADPVLKAVRAATVEKPTSQAPESTVTSPLPQTERVGVRDAVAPTRSPGVITRIVNRVLEVIFKPLIDAAPPAPSGQSPVAWAVLAFVRRHFFNESPVVTAAEVAATQNGDGVITGNIDAVDPDELGKTVQVRASVWAGAAVPTDCGCAPEPGLIGLSFTNPAILGQDPGDNWRAPAAVDNTCAYLDPEDFSVVFYRGTETGQVTVDGLGTGNVVLNFTGTLTEGGASERSVATLVPELGTGALKGVTGTVTSVSSFNSDGSLNGVLTGTVVRPELRYVLVGKPKHGTVTVDKLTGAFTYTPDPGFAGEGGADAFRVLVTDKRFNLLNLFKRYNGDPVHTINLNVAATQL